MSNNVHLEHALIDVSDLSASLTFYRLLFPEWTTRWEGHTMAQDRWVHFGPTREGQPGYLSIYEIPGAGASSDTGGVRIEHIGFAHPDVDGLVKRVAGAGLEPSDRTEDGEYRRAYFTDPDGHELEFVQKLS